MLIAVGCGKKEPEIPSAKKSMEKHKKVIIFTNPVNAPFESGSGTGAQGMGIDIGNEIGKTLNIEVKWITVKDGYDKTFELLAKGEGELVISSAVSDPEKDKTFDFSKPYFETGDVMAVQRLANTSVSGPTTLASLAGKKVGVCKGRPGDTFMTAQKTAANVTIQRYPSMDDALGALNRTEIDAVVGDQEILAYSIVNSYNNTTLIPNKIDNYGYRVAVRKGETELLQKINETIDRMQSSGQLQQSKDSWVDDWVGKAIALMKEDQEVNAKKKAPKSIAVAIHKLGGAWKMDGLDGFQLTLQGSGGSYKSTPIETEGNNGRCRFASVPPGEYSLQMPISRTPARVKIDEVPKTSLSMDLNISASGMTVLVK